MACERATRVCASLHLAKDNRADDFIDPGAMQGLLIEKAQGTNAQAEDGLGHLLLQQVN